MPSKFTKLVTHTRKKNNIVLIPINQFKYINQFKFKKRLLKLSKKYDNIIHCNLGMKNKFIDCKLKKSLLNIQNGDDQDFKYYQCFYVTKNMTFPFLKNQLKYHKIFSRKKIVNFLSHISDEMIFILNVNQIGKQQNRLLNIINKNNVNAKITIWDDLDK